MSIWSIIGKEIRHNRLSFAIGWLCVSVACGLVVGLVASLGLYELQTERIVLQKERETREEMRRLEDDYRLMMREMGYNVLVLHADQSLDALRMDGAPNTYLPLDYVFQLSTGGVENLNHLFPILQQRVFWPEQEREIILCGVMGQVPNFHKPEFLTAEGQYRNPIRPTLPAGAVEMGHDIARSAGATPGEVVTLFGEVFTVHRVHDRRGNDDDVIVWCDLETMQRWFDLQGKINGILALECVCDFETFGLVEAELRSILPDVQVVEFGTVMRARAQARARAAQMRETALDAEIAYRTALGEERQRLARWLLPMVVAGAVVWVFFLIQGNVKERRAEIAVMRAVGVGARKILGIFLGKAAAIGAAGAVTGVGLGLLGAVIWGDVAVGEVIAPGLMLVTFFGALWLAVLAGYIPAMRAARLDPAVILREE